ncbi:MAG TPA: yteA family sporulation protein, partial [Candidatus Dormibacteraeota bacterium]|nr:yteA family sporulation protein [Candidatus Dormibacteraeota bacterium]
KRPVEEDIYSNHINPERNEKETGYDAEDAWQEVSRYGSSETPSDLYGDRDNYNEMYPNSDEDVGIVEDVERYSTTE